MEEDDYELEPIRGQILADIAVENNSQDDKWGTVKETDNFGKRSHAKWFLILGEEIGEAAMSVLDKDPTPELRKECIQSAAVLVQWIEAIDRDLIGGGV